MLARSSARRRPLALIEAACDAVLQHFDGAAGDRPAARAPDAIFHLRLAPVVAVSNGLSEKIAKLASRSSNQRGSYC